MSRDALVIGINQYAYPKQLAPLKTPAADAEAIAQLLETYGDFDVVHRLPYTIKDELRCVDAEYIQDNLVTVTPMTSAEFEQAITKPAEQVGLDIEPDLITQMLQDVEGSPERKFAARDSQI